MIAVTLRAEAMYDADEGQEHTWEDIAPAYHSIPQELVKVYVRTFQSNAARAGPRAKRKRNGTAMWAPSA
jgi:hypothetical protein